MTSLASPPTHRPDSLPHLTAVAACRGCGSSLYSEDVFADLGHAPLANALLPEDSLDKPEIHHRLLALVCRRCLLVQLPALGQSQTYTASDLFPETYPFRSGASAGWVRHCNVFAETYAAARGLDGNSRVLEIGSNDGAGLTRFQYLGIPAMGVEPCQEPAREALRRGIATDIAWWGADYARQLVDSGYQADLVLARNVLAHVPDTLGFLEGVKTVLAPGGTAVIEVPYVGNLVRDKQWDQIYHEHHCYFNLQSLWLTLKRVGLWITAVEEVPVHGGSLRVSACGDRDAPQHDQVSAFRWQAIEAGVHQLDTYLGFASCLAEDKRQALRRLVTTPGRSLVGYGASAKAITLLNYCGIGRDIVEAVVDSTPSKQGKYLPGSHIPVRSPEWMQEQQPEVIVNFLWNWRQESERNIRAACPDAHILYLKD